MLPPPHFLRSTGNRKDICCLSCIDNITTRANVVTLWQHLYGKELLMEPTENNNETYWSTSFLLASFSLRDFGFGPRFAAGCCSTSLSSNTWMAKCHILTLQENTLKALHKGKVGTKRRETNLDQPWVENVLLWLPSAIFWTPPFPFDQVLKMNFDSKLLM